MRKLLCICAALGLCGPACAAFDPFAHITDGIAQDLSVDMSDNPLQTAQEAPPTGGNVVIGADSDMVWLLPLEPPLQLKSSTIQVLDIVTGHRVPVGDFPYIFGVTVPQQLMRWEEQEALAVQKGNVVNVVQGAE